MGFLEDFAPTTLHQLAIVLSLADPLVPRRALQPIRFLVMVDATLAPRGLVLPIEEMITGPGPAVVRQTGHRYLLPQELTFTPRKSGTYQLLLREAHHDKHYGTLVFDVG